MERRLRTGRQKEGRWGKGEGRREGIYWEQGEERRKEWEGVGEALEEGEGNG